MNILFSIVLGLALTSVLLVLFLGIFAMAKGGDFNKKYGHKLMRARITLQGLALLLFVLAYFAARN